jgi:hypothetical protein
MCPLLFIYYLYCVLFERGLIICVIYVFLCCISVKYHWVRVETHLHSN